MSDDGGEVLCVAHGDELQLLLIPVCSFDAGDVGFEEPEVRRGGTSLAGWPAKLA